MAGATAPTLGAAERSAAPVPEWLEVVGIRVGAGVAALAIGAIFLAATGHDPSVTRAAPAFSMASRPVAARPRRARCAACRPGLPGPIAGSRWVIAPTRTWTTPPIRSGPRSGARDQPAGDAPSTSTRAAAISRPIASQAWPASSAPPVSRCQPGSVVQRPGEPSRATAIPWRSMPWPPASTTAAPARAMPSSWNPKPAATSGAPTAMPMTARRPEGRGRIRVPATVGARWRRLATTTSPTKPTRFSHAWAGFSEPHAAATAALPPMRKVAIVAPTTTLTSATA